MPTKNIIHLCIISESHSTVHMQRVYTHEGVTHTKSYTHKGVTCTEGLHALKGLHA